MAMKPSFVDKLLERLDRLDPKSFEPHFLQLVQERGLLETIFQSIQEGVIVIDEDGRLTYSNRAAEHLLGFSREEVRRRPISRYLHDIDWERLLAIDLGGEGQLIHREIEVTYPEHRFISFYVVPLFAEDEHTRNGAVVILRDVTQDRQSEASMLESERIKAVQLLAAGVAHEIGNPLNALNIHLQLLEREIRGLTVDEPEAAAPPAAPDLTGLQELVEVARCEVSRLDQIINQFLRAIRPTHPELVLTRVDALLKETLALLKHEIQNREIKVEIHAEGTIPRVPADRDQIKQAFFNIVRNAFQAMPDGGGLRIALSCSDNFVEIAFSDSGSGITPEDFGRIFDPYYTTKQQGSGLGLMIVQRIIQDHGGQLDVVSKPNAGTRFTIMLPLAERRVRLLKAPPRKPPAATTTGET